MKLLEYEAKALLARNGMPTPAAQLLTGDHGVDLDLPLVLKVQIPKGGRGKAGGIKLVRSQQELEQTAARLLSQPLLGYTVDKLLAEEALEIERELYLAITLDRTERCLVLLAHKSGGIDIEEAATKSEMLKIPLSTEPSVEVDDRLFKCYGLPNESKKQLHELCQKLYKACINEDALLIEINPLVLTQDNRLVCADAKIELDDSAAFRHDWQYELKPESTQFVVLNERGNVGSMANGAGLAMATVDAIQASGATPANFLDVGGGTNTAGMVKSFQRLSNLPNLRAIVVNIFGGITRCDEVANAIVEARNSVTNLPPLFIRLTGTNETAGQEILADAGISTLPDLKSCVDAAKEAA